MCIALFRFSLNDTNEVIAFRSVVAGVVSQAIYIHPREVFADPIADQASDAIIAHDLRRKPHPQQ